VITFEEAKRIAIEKIGTDCALVESATVEKPYGWYFFGQSRTYLETGDFKQMLVGSGGFIVERADGRVFEFGSAYSTEQWIANYERGFKYHSYDLTISAVFEPDTAVRLLERLDMTYVIPENDDGTVWVIPRRFTREQLRQQLGLLPCAFAGQRFWHRVDVFDEIDASRCCKYKLSEHIPETGRDPKTPRRG
jgi:hypothetical protein